MIKSRVKYEGEVAVLTPGQEAGQVDNQGLVALVEEIIESLDAGQVKHVVADFSGSDYFGSPMVSTLLKIGNKVKGQDGQMALAALSDSQLEILGVMALNTFWPTFDSLDDALESMGTQSS